MNIWGSYALWTGFLSDALILILFSFGRLIRNMYKVARPDAIKRVFSCKTLWVALCWITGLVVGTVIAAGTDLSAFSLMRRALFGQVSIVNLFAAAAFPFLLAAYAVFIDRPRLLLLICGIKALCFAFCAYMTAASFGTAGWLVQPLVQFMDLCLVPVLCWFCIRHISGPLNSFRKDIMVCAAAVVAAVSINYFVVSPFLAKLIDI